jgi:glycosyltransferase involved in cell wall biosynthesis
MKIAIVTENGYAGGLDTFITNLINFWPQAEDELVLICNRDHPGLQAVSANLSRPCEIIAHGIPLDWVFMQRLGFLPGILRKLLSIALRYAYFLTYMPQLKSLFNRTAPDRLLIVNGGYPGGYTCRAAAIVWARDPARELSIHNFHNLAYPPRWWEAWVENRIDGLVERHSKKMISTSHASAETIRERPAMAGSTKVGFIHNGTEGPPAKASSGNTIRKDLSIPPDSPIVAMLGTYEPRKGHCFLLEAFVRVREALPNVHLVISGFGQEDEIARVEGFVTELQLNDSVHLEGFWIDRHDLMDEARVVVVASQGFESFGLTLVEAMSHKVPVVSTRIGGTPEVMHDDEGGFSVEPQDLEGFAEKLTLLLNDKAVWQEKSAGGYRRYQEYFTIGRMAADYAALVRADSTDTPDAVAKL